MRIFKYFFRKKERIKNLVADMDRMRLQIENKRKLIEELKESIMSLMSEMNDYVVARDNAIAQRDEALNNYDMMLNEFAEAEARRDEVINRLQSPIPDEIIGSKKMSEYKFWIAQPLIDVEFKKYVPKDPDETFVDGISAIQNMGGIIAEGKRKRETESG